MFKHTQQQLRDCEFDKNVYVRVWRKKREGKNDKITI